MKVITCVNDKGGSCKTTTIYNLASQKALEGYKVLMIDLDACGSLTNVCCHIEVGEDDATIGSLLMPVKRKLPELNVVDILQSIMTVDTFNAFMENKRGNTEVADNLCIIPTGKDGELITVNDSLMDVPVGREKALKNILTKLNSTDIVKFDYVFLDCPGSMNVLTINALVAADVCIVPFEATRGNTSRFSEVFDTINTVKDMDLNRDLQVPGVLACRIKRRKSENDILSGLEIESEYNVIGSIKESAEVTRYEDLGVGVVVAKPYCDASMAYAEIADML